MLGMIAVEETYSIFLAPLLSASLKAVRVMQRLSTNLGPTAFDRVAKSRAGRPPAREENDVGIVCYWGLALADGKKLDPKERDVGLNLIAEEFRVLFKEVDVGDDAPLELHFNSNDRKMDPSFWEKGGPDAAHVKISNQKRRYIQALFADSRRSQLTVTCK